MATIMDTLFGVSAERFQQERDAAADAQALQYARLSPIEKASFGVQRGAYGLAGALGGALGGKDPELARNTMRQQIAGQINFADPKSIFQGVDLLRQSNDPQGAMMLADVGREAESKVALTQQRLRERAAADPFQKLVESGKYTTPSLAAYQRSGLVEDLDLVKPEKTEKDPRFGDLRESVAGEMFENRSFFQLTPSEKAVVNKKVDEQTRATARESAPKFALPGQDKLVEIPKFRADVQKTIEKPLASISAADQALLAIDDSIKTNNFVSFNAARVQLAKALGDSQLSRRDIEQAGGDPSLFGSLLDSTSTLFTSTPSLDTQNQIKKTLQAIRKLSANKANTEVGRQRKIAIAAGYPKEVVEMALTFDDLLPSTTAPISGDLAEQARALLKQRQEVKK
jgi:hypothetical protein